MDPSEPSALLMFLFSFFEDLFGIVNWYYSVMVGGDWLERHWSDDTFSEFNECGFIQSDYNYLINGSPSITLLFLAVTDEWRKIPFFLGESWF